MVRMGLGPTLMQRIINYAKSRGIWQSMTVLSEDEPMLKLPGWDSGFSITKDVDDPEFNAR